MKFGGTSVADVARIWKVAGHVSREVRRGNGVVVVVSAMAGTTDRLVSWVKEAGGDRWDMADLGDVVLASGEQIVTGLLGLCLGNMGIRARAWQGWQVPIVTDGGHGEALIESVGTERLQEALACGEVSVVSGFQGVTSCGAITTLGRGGSDTSAVAIAVALKASRCDIYTDVAGVYTADPRVVENAHRLDRIGYEDMLEMASLGAGVLHGRSVELAMRHGVRILVRSSFHDEEEAVDGASGQSGTIVGTLIGGDKEDMERRDVSGVACSRDVAQVIVRGLEGGLDAFVRLFEGLAGARLNVDMIVHSIPCFGDRMNVTFTVPGPDMDRAIGFVEDMSDRIRYESVSGTVDVAKVSVVGVGMQSHSGIAAQMFRTLAEVGTRIHATTTSEIKISVLIDRSFMEVAVRELHRVYGLDQV